MILGSANDFRQGCQSFGLNEIISRATREAIKESDNEVHFPAPPGCLPGHHLLAALSHCYVRGIYNSNEVARELRLATSLQEQQQPWPDAYGIRLFRRLNRQVLLRALERIFRLLRENNISWPLVSVPGPDVTAKADREGPEIYECQEAHARLEHAILHDRLE
jgi:hypothetical protein